MSKDHILPYMADDRHIPDTLFLVCEEDWRCYREECDVSPDMLATNLGDWGRAGGHVSGFASGVESAVSAQALYQERVRQMPLTVGNQPVSLSAGSGKGGGSSSRAASPASAPAAAAAPQQL